MKMSHSSSVKCLFKIAQKEIIGSQFYGDENNTLRERLVKVKALLALTFLKCREDLLTCHSESGSSGFSMKARNLRAAVLLVVVFLMIIFNSSQSPGHCYG